jgi:arsenate reductase
MIKKTILFLCTGNSCRSQMAEGWCRHLWTDQYDCYSAGTQKHGMNLRAIKVMQELGIDISKQYSKIVDELEIKKFDIVVTVCDHAYENCPYFPGSKIIHIGFQDPPFLTKSMTDENQILDIYRKIRDEIKLKIQNLPQII